MITETQAKLGTFSLNMLGLEQGDRTSQEVPDVLKEYKEASNMIQGVFNVFSSTSSTFSTEEVAADPSGAEEAAPSSARRTSS